MDALVEMSQGDMRVMLGQLQMHRLRASALSFDQVKASASKDMDKSPFDCARRLLSTESAHWSMMDRMDAVFQDLDLVPLLIQVQHLTISQLEVGCIGVDASPCTLPRHAHCFTKFVATFKRVSHECRITGLLPCRRTT